MKRIPPIENTYKVPLIWAQKVNKVFGGSYLKKAIFENVGEPIGPFMTGYEAGRAVGLKTELSVSAVLRGHKPSTFGYRFYYNGEKELKFEIPNVTYAKENGLLKRLSKLNPQNIEENLNIFGLDIVSIGEYQGNKTIIKTKCCNIDCDNTVEKNYHILIGYPVCGSCKATIYGLGWKEYYNTLNDHITSAQ
ncbi:hypothetical protein NDK43_06965 [Neobacillus pocheonensis]|uniref:Formylmethanofuran dehydrogenase subunit E domain-containing protein n=1 Tax=Neobacillus pocheonensis TaxID=363869 RepID=A0ABT0W798_9BACI|nr:hypothetical protein [Neobacillus pocheonensis]